MWPPAGPNGTHSQRRRVIGRWICYSSTMARHPLNLERLEDRLLLSISAESQHLIYLLNRARHDPAAYQLENNLPADIALVEARPPLAVNSNLNASALFHSQEMATHNYFGHQSVVTGDWPNKMVRDHGYPLPAIFPNTSNNLESLAAGTFFSGADEPLSALIVDEGIPSLGHRKHLLGMGTFNASFREIGVGHAFNGAAAYDHYWTIHTGFQSTSDTFLTGVAFNDLNTNSRYDPGEGIAGVAVSAGSLQTLTNAAGGWSLQVAPGAHVVQASGGSFQGVSATSVLVTDESVAVDFRSGVPGAMVGFQQQNNLPPVAENDSGTVRQPLAGSLPIFANDSDPEGQLNLQSVTVTTPFQHGTVLFDAATGTMLYQPSPGFFGVDTMRYRVSDVPGLVSNEAVVTVTVLPADFGAWQNVLLPLDVNGDRGITPVDVLWIINDLNQLGSRLLPPLAAGLQPPPYLDVNGDGSVSPVDVLQIINHLNTLPTGSPEGEDLPAGELRTASAVAVDHGNDPVTEDLPADQWMTLHTVIEDRKQEIARTTARLRALRSVELERVIDEFAADVDVAGAVARDVVFAGSDVGERLPQRS